MKARKFALLLLIFCDLMVVSAQERAIDLRFEGKEKGFIKYLSKNLQYPDESLTNLITGYSITGITITPEGDIKDLTTINSLDKSIDEQIKTILLRTKGRWLKSDFIKADQTFYVQVIFQIGISGAKHPSDTHFKGVYNFIEPYTITKDDSKGDGAFETSESIGKKVNECMKNGKSEETIRYVDELIRRNPFNKTLYHLRISLNNKLGKSDLVEKDYQKLQNFIPGVSLENLFNAYAETAVIPTQMPEFYGGKEAISRFISQNLKYPPAAYQMKIEGTVFVRFLIDKDGYVTNAKITQSAHPDLDTEALRVVSLMPVWRPGLKDGKPVNVYFTLPIRFSIN